MPLENDSDIYQKMIDNLGKFIKYNKNLLHIDLSYTRLDADSLIKIGTYLRRAKSLLSIHFSGNPGVNSQVKAYLLDKLHGKDHLNSNFNEDSKVNYQVFQQEQR